MVRLDTGAGPPWPGFLDATGMRFRPLQLVTRMMNQTPKSRRPSLDAKTLIICAPLFRDSEGLTETCDLSCRGVARCLGLISRVLESGSESRHPERGNTPSARHAGPPGQREGYPVITRRVKRELMFEARRGVAGRAPGPERPRSFSRRWSPPNGRARPWRSGCRPGVAPGPRH